MYRTLHLPFLGIEILFRNTIHRIIFINQTFSSKSNISNIFKSRSKHSMHVKSNSRNRNRGRSTIHVKSKNHRNRVRSTIHIKSKYGSKTESKSILSDDRGFEMRIQFFESTCCFLMFEICSCKCPYQICKHMCCEKSEKSSVSG